MHNSDYAMSILSDTNALVTDSHIVYTSGKHGTAYVNKDAIYPNIEHISHLCYLMASEFNSLKPDIVIGPAIGGVILSQWTAHHLAVGSHHPLSVYAEKVVGFDDFVIKRGYEKLIPGKMVLVVEDVLTTGGSVKKVVDAVHALHGTVVGVGALVNRGGVTEMDIGGVPVLKCLINVKLDAWDEAECPMCKAGTPINTSVGKGREYLAKKNQNK
jgi:orotate phosphoribosyltransferase